RYAFDRPRVTAERRYSTIGTASTVPTIPLNRIPTFMKRPRRDINVSFDMVSLRVLVEVRCGVRLSRTLDSVRCKPCDNIRDFLIGHWSAADIAPPVGRP